MKAKVVCQFRMESRDELIALPCRYDASIEGCHGPGLAEDTTDIRSAYEGHGDVEPYPLYVMDSMEAAQLSPVGIATNLDVHRGEMRLREQDESGTCAEHGQSLEYIIADGGFEM